MRLADHPATADQMILQIGLITRRQLLGHGWSAGTVDGAVQRGCLEVVHRGVYRVPGSARPPQQEALAAVLRAGSGARITGGIVLRRLRRPALVQRAPTIVLVPAPRRLPSDPVAWRRDRAPGRDDHHLGPIPATSPARAFLEVATVGPQRHQLTIIDHLRWDGLATTVDLVTCAQHLGRRHAGARPVLDLIADGHLERESHGERDLAAGLDRLGIGGLVRWQVDIAPGLRVDGLLEVARAVLEYDGRAHHTDPRDRSADARRDGRLAGRGLRVVRITAQDLRSDATLRAKLERELGIDLASRAQLVG